uniref:Uncharacterized protein n=1 Tax=Dicentrarchus labrax TaxID=13489 RepID=A0A8C4HDY9_DICLA
DHVELLDGVQRLLFALQPDNIGIGNHLLCKPPHRVLEGCREKQHLTVSLKGNPPMDTYALVPVTLCGDHHISLVQHKHGDLLGFDEPVLGAPVEDCAWCSNDNLLLQLDYGYILTSVAPNTVGKFHIRAVFPHLLDDLSNLQSKLVCWRDAKNYCGVTLALS